MNVKQLQTWAVIVATLTLVLVAFGTFAPQMIVGYDSSEYTIKSGINDLCTLSNDITLDKDQYAESEQVNIAVSTMTVDFSNTEVSPINLGFLEMTIQYKYYYYIGNDETTKIEIHETYGSTISIVFADLSENAILEFDLSRPGATLPADLQDFDFIWAELETWGDYRIGLYPITGDWNDIKLSKYVSSLTDGSGGPPNGDTFPFGGTVKTTSGSYITTATISAGGLTAYSDNWGEFIIPAMPSGIHTLSVSAPGFTTYNEQITISDATTMTITLVGTGEEPPPDNQDSDGDGWTDQEEIEAGTDPNDPNDYPITTTAEFEFTNSVLLLIAILIIALLGITALIPIPPQYKLLVIMAIVIVFLYLIWEAGTGNLVIL